LNIYANLKGKGKKGKKGKRRQFEDPSPDGDDPELLFLFID
jgi:hypothetical protein